MKRKTQLKSHKPMARGTVRMRSVKPKSEKPKRAARETGEHKLCIGQPCYLLVPGIANHDRQTVVGCHSNEIALGKGKGIKTPDIYSVPGCHACHMEIDQGAHLTKYERRAIWRSAYARWGPCREEQFGVPYVPIDT